VIRRISVRLVEADRAMAPAPPGLRVDLTTDHQERSEAMTDEEWGAEIAEYLALHSLPSLLHVDADGGTAELLIEVGGADVAVSYLR
jgi:hypothetical protein